MITRKDLEVIDLKYFQIVETSGFQVSLKSINTGHFWSIVSDGISLEHNHFKLYHKHRYQDQFHYQMNVRNFKSALYEIKKHDEYQLNGRKS